MSNSELFERAYRQLWAEINCDSVPAPLPHAEYESAVGELTLGIVYGMQEQDSLIELANLYNSHAYWLHRLAIWEHVLTRYADNEADELRYEFTRLPADHCLHTPYQFRARIIFCSTQLLYAKKHIQAPDSQKQTRVVADDDINFGTLKNLTSDSPAERALLAATLKLDQRELREVTDNYRNRAQHQMPRGIDFGHIFRVEKHIKDGKILSYAIGNSPPLKTSDLIQPLKEEGLRMLEALDAFKALIREHKCANF